MRHILLGILLSATLNTFAQVGIGTSTPGSSAQLDVTSTTKGFLPPRMTFAQRNLIPSPAAGLVIWCIDCDELQVYNGTIWKNMSGVAASGPSLPNVVICDQVWMVKNLNVTTYTNGDPIPQVTDPAVWASLTIGAWCWYNNDPANAVYGKLYNWYAVNDARGLAPLGWHVASNEEWLTLANCLGSTLTAGAKLKEAGTTHWLAPNEGATNTSGFTALPGGYRLDAFGSLREIGFWWTSTESNTSSAFTRAMYHDLITSGGAQVVKTYGFSVRCLRD